MKVAIPLLLFCFLSFRVFLPETPAAPFLPSSYPLPSCDPTRFAPQKIITPFRGLRMNAVLIRYTRKVKYKRASGAKGMLPLLAARMRTQNERRNLDPFSFRSSGRSGIASPTALGVPL